MNRRDLFRTAAASFLSVFAGLGPERQITARPGWTAHGTVTGRFASNRPNDQYLDPVQDRAAERRGARYGQARLEQEVRRIVRTAHAKGMSVVFPGRDERGVFLEMDLRGIEMHIEAAKHEQK